MQIERAGISAATARKAVDDVFGEIDADALLEAALTRRMLGRDRIEDDKEFQRLYRYLLNQGFDAERVMSACCKLGERSSAFEPALPGVAVQ